MTSLAHALTECAAMFKRREGQGAGLGPFVERDGDRHDQAEIGDASVDAEVRKQRDLEQHGRDEQGGVAAEAHHGTVVVVDVVVVVAPGVVVVVVVVGSTTAP